MHRCISIIKTTINHHRRPRHVSNALFSSSPSATTHLHNPVKNLQNSDQPSPPPPPAIPHKRNLKSRITVTATLISAAVAAMAFIFKSNEHNNSKNKNVSYKDLNFAIDQSNRIFETVRVVTVLLKSLSSVLTNVNYEFEVRVAALLADIVAADESRRAAIIGGGGFIVDWLLDSVALNRGGSYAAQAESARALAYLISDYNVAHFVLSRPHAVPNLLRFIFSAHPHPQEQNQMRRFEIGDPLKGRSMLVAAIMDIVTSHCDNVDKVKSKPMLSKKAAMRDIEAALQVLEEGGMYWGEGGSGEEGKNDGTVVKGIGVKRVLGFSGSHGSIEIEDSRVKARSKTKRVLFNKINDNSPNFIPGLWDDLHCQHVAVPFAAWALANWAMASDVNRSHIQELDHDGHAVVTALAAPERSVKWHGSLVARFLLEDRDLPSDDFVSDWSSSLLSTVSQASKGEDVCLTRVALSAFLLSLERCPRAQEEVMEKSLYLMRETAKRMKKHESIQEALAKGLESLCTGNIHLTLDEGQKWSSILLRWVFGNTSSDATRSSAIRILSHILEDHAPSSVPISQGWLTILLGDILKWRMSSLKGSAQPKDKVKTQIDQANIASGTQAANQLAIAVVNLAINQLGTESLEDLLRIEPFVVPFKKVKKDSKPKVNAADSALATLKGIKTMSEICSDDTICQTRIIDHGVVSLLRRLLLRDDYEILAAREAYNASKNMKSSDHQPASVPDVHDLSKVRVPPAAHIRRHAARFLTGLSVHPKVKEFILNDKVWCDWLEECANGKIPGCNDLKTRSYARATLLNIFCNDYDIDSDSERKHRCPHFTEMIYLINPDLSHWKYPIKERQKSAAKTPLDNSGCVSHSDPPLDVVFVHGLRGGPFKSWRLSECKSSSKSGLVEKIDEEAGKQGTFWPAEWLSSDFPQARLFSLKYKTNLTQWSGSSLPLQEVSSMLLEKLITAGIGDRPVVFVTHSMGGLVVKQMLHQARTEKRDDIVNNTIGVVFYSCPHFGSKLADLPWRMGFVLRPAPTIGELRSGSPTLIKLNDFIRHLHKKGSLDVLSFCETKVTPIVEGYGGWAFRLEIVPIESSYPGYGNYVVLESTDHVNSCKPISKSDPSYHETLHLLHKLRACIHERTT
uniref:uncharacterized protein LOC122586477 n=1 Tax=Erigeron canadensis TaxID=72917 RepID=UPI001CB8B640|nr:uncharacterized protein LOC122586477 [Erigeron canadensis]